MTAASFRFKMCSCLNDVKQTTDFLCREEIQQFFRQHMTLMQGLRILVLQLEVCQQMTDAVQVGDLPKLMAPG